MLALMALIDDEEDLKKFKRIYNNYGRFMMQIVHSILENTQDAEDTVQEALICIAEKISIVDDSDPVKVKNFVRIIAKRRAWDMYRKLHPCELEYIDDIAAQFYDELEYIQDFDGMGDLAKCILKLPDSYRDIILLKYYLGYELKEIAAFLGIKLNYVKKLDQRAKAKLMEICKEEGYDI